MKAVATEVLWMLMPLIVVEIIPVSLYEGAKIVVEYMITHHLMGL